MWVCCIIIENKYARFILFFFFFFFSFFEYLEYGANVELFIGHAILLLQWIVMKKTEKERKWCILFYHTIPWYRYSCKSWRSR